MKRIGLKTNRYGTGFESEHIRVTGSRTASTYLCFYPSNIEKHGFAAKEGKLDSWVLFAVQPPVVIDNYGGSAAERERMQVELEIGEPFTIDGIEGTWQLVDCDRRTLEGDGVKPVPYEESICAQCGTAITRSPVDGAWEDEKGACGCGDDEHTPEATQLAWGKGVK